MSIFLMVALLVATFQPMMVGKPVSAKKHHHMSKYHLKKIPLHGGRPIQVQAQERLWS